MEIDLRAARYPATRMGRTVPLVAHAASPTGAAETVRALAAKYADDPRVHTVAVDNAKGRGNADVAPLDALPRASRNRLHETLKTVLDAEHQAGLVSDNLYRGFNAPDVEPARGAADGQHAEQVGEGELSQAAREAGDTTYQASVVELARSTPPTLGQGPQDRESNAVFLAHGRAA